MSLGIRMGFFILLGMKVRIYLTQVNWKALWLLAVVKYSFWDFVICMVGVESIHLYEYLTLL